MKYHDYVALVLAFVGTACWAICFWWMHRISVHQETMLRELHAVTQRIEKLSKEEHQLISEVHPAVTTIKDSVQDVAAAVEATDSAARDGGSRKAEQT